jgi:hypothetical protein
MVDERTRTVHQKVETCRPASSRITIIDEAENSPLIAIPQRRNHKISQLHPSHSTTRPSATSLFPSDDLSQSSVDGSLDVPEVLYKIHDKHGHCADRTLIKQLAMRAWWPTRTRDVAQDVSTCEACSHFGSSKRSVAIKPILTYGPFDMLDIDLIGHLDGTTQGNRYILHIVDYFTRVSWESGTGPHTQL